MAGIGGDFLNDLVLVAKTAAVSGRRARVAAYIKTAVITVTPGAGQMIVNMNGRDYILRGAEADAFRKEYVAIQRPEAKVNALVEKYMNALQPLKKQTVPMAPGVLEREQQETRAKELADADKYWAGHGAPTPQEEKRYMTQSAAYVEHKEEGQGQAPDFKPLTGSTDGEFSDITGAEDTDLSKMGDQEISMGDLVEIKGDMVPGQVFEVGFVRDGNAKLQDPKTHERIPQGYAKNWIPVGSLKKVGISNPEGSRLANKKADAASALVSSLQEGDEVRGRVGANEFVGAIESINGDKVVVKSPRGPKRTFDIKDLRLESEVEAERAHGKQEWEEEGRQLSEAEKAQRREERIQNSVSVQSPTGSAGQMVPELQRRGYSLTLKYKAPQYLQQAETEWSDWTGGEQLSDECSKQYDTMYGREWTLVYNDKDRNMPVFFEIDPMGTHEGKRSLKPIGLSQKDRVVVNYPEIISELVKAGLRMNCGASTQELGGTMASAEKKACGDMCAQCDEEVQLPAAIQVMDGGEKSLPPAETTLPESEKEAAVEPFLTKKQMKPIADMAWGDVKKHLETAPKDCPCFFCKNKGTSTEKESAYTPEETQNQSKMKWLPYRKPDGQLYWMDANGVEHQYEKALSGRDLFSLEDAHMKDAGFNFFFPGQVLKEFYPEVQHEIVNYPNENNSPMIEDIDLDSALDTSILGSVRMYADSGSNYVSTAPGGIGIGRDGKPQVLDGAPLRKENDIRGGMFMDEFHQQYDGVPGALLAVASWKPTKTAGDEKQMFNKFLKLVMGEIAATMIAAFKVTNRPMTLNQVPGIGEVQLTQVEQPSSLSSFNIVNTGSRVKYLLDKLNDGDIKEAIDKARAQAAVWLDDPSGGFVYEVFVRAETIDTDSLILKYKFVTGTKESE